MNSVGPSSPLNAKYAVLIKSLGIDAFFCIVRLMTPSYKFTWQHILFFIYYIITVENYILR